MRRQRMNRKRSKRTFKRGARRVHSKNKMQAVNMRGGIRL